jgi:hypothetical protein
VESGDQIHTGAESYVQIRFTDWGVISLRPRTDFVIDEYVYEQNQGGREKAFFSLIKGGIRSLTGFIGHRDRSKYRLRTQTSTIGIRGTLFGVLMCQQDCRNADGSLGADGLYGGVIEGRIAVGPYGGSALEREFGAGQYFRLDNENSIPAPLLAPPPFFWDPLALVSDRHFAGTPWAGKPGATPGPSDTTAVSTTIGNAAGAVAGPVITAVAPALGSTVGSVAGPVIAPVTPVVSPLLNPVLAPVAPVISPVLNPGLAPVTPVISPVVNPVGLLPKR